MKEKISVSLVQPQMFWEDVEANLSLLDVMLESVSAETDLIILPETFSTGFTMQSDKYAEGSDGRAVQWMQRMAQEKKSYISGSVIIRDKEKIYNRLYWISPEGVEGQYDKRHLFRMGRENKNFVPGKSREVFKLGAFRILPQICYDLRFPVFSRNQGDYDVLFYVANWPAPRQQVWEILTRARAMENQSYLLGVNRVGMDGMGVAHSGGSCAINPLGDEMHRMDHKPGIQTVTLDLKKLRDYRERFPVWKDADKFSL